MADPTVLTAIVGAAAGVIGAATPLILERRHERRERREQERAQKETGSAVQVASWEGLNDALYREISRLEKVIETQRLDNETKLDQQRQHYEAKIASDRQRITELETEVAALQRTLREPRAP